MSTPAAGTSSEPQEHADAALVVVGHGSTQNADAAAPVYLQTDVLRRQGRFAQVIEGFWKQEPFLRSVLRGVFAPRVFIVPFFISEGYFTEEVVPRELGFRPAPGKTWDRIQRRGTQTFHYCRPIGTHDRMTEVLLEHAADVVTRHPFPRCPPPSAVALFLAGHGTRENDHSRAAIEHQVDRIRARRLYAHVEGVFLEEEPRVGSCYSLSPVRNLVVVPFFVSDGLHTFQDIPRMLGETEPEVARRLENGQFPWRNPSEKQGHLVWYARSIGRAPSLTEVILERVRESARLESNPR